MMIVVIVSVLFCGVAFVFVLLHHFKKMQIVESNAKMIKMLY